MPFIRPTYRPTIRDLSSYLLAVPNWRSNPGCLFRLHRPCRRPALISCYMRSLYTYVGRLSARRTQSYDRGPISTEDTQTDFTSLDILSAAAVPSTSIDACLWDGFHLDSGVKITDGMGVLLVAGEAFSWQPWKARRDGELRLVNEKGQWEVEDEAWGVFEVMWPKPDLLILGLGKEMRPLSPKTKSKLNNLGIRVDLQDTRNAAAQFNLLATERGVACVSAALIPIGWQEGVGVK